MSNEKPKPFVSWMKLKSDFDKQKLTSLLLTIINGLLLLVITYMIMRSPLVIKVRDGYNKDFYYPTRASVQINETDLEAVALKFVRTRYSWDALDQSSILKGISPFVTDNLRSKIKKELIKLAKQFPKDKSISQSITGIKTDVTMEKIIISFDQIIKIDGVPLVTSKEIEFLMIKDSPNRLNPLGIYVNNITQYEAI